MKHALTLIAAAAFVTGVATTATAADADGSQLSATHNCKLCHAVDQKVVGPGYREIAKRYAGDPAAPAKLATKIRSGGSGAWGAVPMPPNNLPDADLKALVAWILSQG